MRAPSIRIAMSLAVASMAAALLLPSPAAADDRVFMSSEAWYLELPPCQSLLDCSPVPPVSPYPKDTLHVASTLVAETARTYLSFSVPTGSGDLSGGTLTLPVDSNPLHGTLLPDRAEMVACLVSGSVEPVRGSLAVPPPADCTVSSPATYDAKSTSFTVSLAAFASKWAAAGTASLALLPAPNPANGPSIWHVTFFSTTEDSKSMPPITATLTFTPTSGGPPSGSGGFPPPPSSGTAPPVSFDGVGMGPTPTAQPPAAPATRVVPFLGGFAGSGFAYAIVWALPLVLLGGLGAIGRALTKSLYRRGL